ncbi:hypothetical protein B0H13DRAFT_2667932 [Mycena leptocephala]|nr:hypothetical protein B0H13DRAFT_2667932 [Mycena leptocephala]
MSQSPTPIFAASTSLYRYLIVGALSIVVCIGLTLFWRARVIERRLALLRALQPARLEDGLALGKRPRLYDVYLDGHGESWAEIMPLSLDRARPLPVHNSKSAKSKHASASMSMDVDEDLSATVTLMITMPSSVPSSRKPARSPQDIEDGEDEASPLRMSSSGSRTCRSPGGFRFGLAL